MAHALRAYAAPTIDPDTISKRLSVDEDRYDRVLSEQDVSPRISQQTALDDRPKHLHAVLRFDKRENINEVVETIADGTLYESEWVAIDVHECTHDTGGGTCGSWERVVERGPVPDEI